MIYIIISTLTGAFALGFCKFFAWEALCAQWGEPQRPWLIQAIGALMTLGPVFAFFVASPLSQKAPAGKIMASANFFCIFILALGALSSFWGSPWIYLLLIGFGSGLFSAARQNAIPRLCLDQNLKAVKVNAAVSVAFVLGLLAGFPSGAEAYSYGPLWGLAILSLALGISAIAALKIPQPIHQMGSAAYAWKALFPESLSLLSGHARVLWVSPLLWAITGAISLAVTAFAVEQGLGSPAQCSLISLYAAMGCMVGNAVSPYFEKKSVCCIGYSALAMCFLTFGIPYFIEFLLQQISPLQVYISLAVWMSILGLFFGMASNLLDAQYLMQVAEEKRDGLGSAMLSAFIAGFSFIIGGLVAIAILAFHIDAHWQFKLLAGLLLMATVPMLLKNSPMKFSFCLGLICNLIHLGLRLRYRLKITPVQNLGGGGKLFLPNHPALIDPVMMVTLLWKKHHLVPVVDEAMYKNPASHWIMKRIEAMPLPDISLSGGWYTRHKVEMCIQEIQNKLNQGQSVLLYPSGKIMRGNLESLGANSGLHSILVGCNPDVEVIAVRTRGLLGSSFSCSFNGGIVPKLGEALGRAIRCALLNGLFLLKKREVSICFEKMDTSQIKALDRLELNKKFEDFYAAEGPEEVRILPYGPFYNIPNQVAIKAEINGLEALPKELEELLRPKLAELSGHEVHDLRPDMNFEDDFGLDSLARAELQTWFEEELDLVGVQMSQIQNLSDLAKIFLNGTDDKTEDESVPLYTRQVQTNLFDVRYDTLQENILAMLLHRHKEELFVDKSGQKMNAQKLHISLLLLARHFRKHDHQRIAVLLPASMGATLTVGALILAGKTPLMLNFTSGIKNIKASLEVAKAERIVTSTRFLSKLKGVDLDDFADQMFYLEDLKFSKIEKTIAWYWSRANLEQQKQYLEIQNLDGNATACILFTSGSESVPKAVPLSHKNLLTNIRGALHAVDFKGDDVMLGFLPPFHSFGMTFGTLLPLVTGLRMAYHPNPLESKALAGLAKNAQTTLVLGTPAFLSAVCSKMKEPWITLRYAVTGAEKAPDTLFETIARLAPQAQILEGYGSTECSPVITLNLPNQKRLGVGKPFKGISIKIVDENFTQERSPGEKGLILVQGDSVFSGYLNSDKNPFVQWEGSAWYNTGDLGCLSEEGDVILMGRLKRFVKIAGEMISLPALETQLRAEYEPQDAEGPQLAMESMEIDGEKAQIVLFSCIPLDKEVVNAMLRQKGFPALAKVSSVRQVDSIPLIGTGKIDYRLLKEWCRGVQN